MTDPWTQVVPPCGRSRPCNDSPAEYQIRTNLFTSFDWCRVSLFVLKTSLRNRCKAQVSAVRHIFNSTMSTSWFLKQVAPDGMPEDGCHPDEAKALEDYCQQKTSPQEAAKAITRRIENEDDPGNNLYSLWGLLISALVELPSSQTPALIQLLAAIQELPEPDLTGKQTRNTPPENGYMWRTLPEFVNDWADEHNRDDWRLVLAAQRRSEEPDKLRALHVKRANVEAQLVVAQVSTIPVDFGLNCICDALEQSDVVVDFEVPAAAEWMAIAGKQIHAAAVDGNESWALWRTRDLWPGREKVMSRERLMFWETQLRKLLDQPHDEATRVAARRALQDMQALASV